MNYGIVGGAESGLFILDADLDKSAAPDEGWHLSAAETYELVIRDYGLQLKGTFKVRTPSGGVHHYFAWPAGADKSDFAGHSVQHRNLGRGMDFALHGGYVVGPGSVLDDGRVYRASNLEAALAELPNPLLQDVRKRASRVDSERSQVKSRPSFKNAARPITANGRGAEAKKLIAGDPVWAEQKGKQGSTLRFHGSMAFGTNNILPAPEYTDGWFRRWRYLQLPGTVHERTLTFDEETLRTEAELSGVFNRALAALERIERLGFSAPESSQRLERLFRSHGRTGVIRYGLSDPRNGLVIDERDAKLQIGTGRAWASFKSWVERQGFNKNDLPGRNSEFHDYMKRHFDTKRLSTGGDHYLGIREERVLRVIDDGLVLEDKEIVVNATTGEVA